MLPTHDRRELAAIFCGGIVGALARAGLAQAFPDSARSWPWAIFAANIVGAFLLGYFVTRLAERLPTSAYMRPFLGTGLCGALTTFSTDAARALQDEPSPPWTLATGYAAATVAASFAAVTAGDRAGPAGADGPVTLGTWVLVALLGGTGSIARFIIDGLVGERAGGGVFPWGTFMVNISGAALLGGLAGAAVTGTALILAGTATLGSYTTLSTWMLESHRLGEDDRARRRLGQPARLAGDRVRRGGRGSRRGVRAVNEDCLKLTAYFAERDRSGGRFLGDALLAICERHGLATSVLLRGAEGFGRHQVLQTDRLLSLSEDLPMVLAAVDTRSRIEAALPEVGDTAEHGLVTLERARLLTGQVGRSRSPRSCTRPRS